MGVQFRIYLVDKDCHLLALVQHFLLACYIDHELALSFFDEIG